MFEIGLRNGMFIVVLKGYKRICFKVMNEFYYECNLVGIVFVYYVCSFGFYF